MTTARAQLDAAEAWLLEEWRKRLSDQRHPGFVDFGERDRDSWLEARSELATAIRAIRFQRKAIDDAAAITSGPTEKVCE